MTKAVGWKKHIPKAPEEADLTLTVQNAQKGEDTVPKRDFRTVIPPKIPQEYVKVVEDWVINGINQTARELKRKGVT